MNARVVMTVSNVRPLAALRMLLEGKKVLLHRHFSMASEPATEVVFPGQAMHTALEAACGVTEKVLAGQLVQTDEPVAA